jgi:hypothetical protein
MKTLIETIYPGHDGETPLVVMRGKQNVVPGPGSAEGPAGERAVAA